MKRIITLIMAMSFALAMGGCSYFKKGNKSSAAPAKTEKMADKKAAPAKSAGKKAAKGKRIYCSSKKTYAKGTACWHWKRGARIGKSAAKK